MLFHAISYSTSVSDDIAAICKIWVILPWLNFTSPEYIRILIHILLSVVTVEDEVTRKL